ncbi:MAG: hypothetical protein GXO02_04685, partial [Epsilonproteobacteria bacterium]|nr:hypothetical protein [Campylobacterota bacterium]
AKELKKDIFQWIDEDINTKEIEDPIQKELLSSEYVIKSSLDEFNQTLRRKLETLKEPQKEQRDSNGSYQQVFINAVDKDLAIANEISKILSDSVEIEFIDEESPNIREEVEEKVLNCHHYILVFGEVPKEWVKIQLRNFKKLKNKRDKSINSLILYKAPPKMPQKDIIPIRFPCLKEIDAQEAHQYEKIKEIILGCENGK